MPRNERLAALMAEAGFLDRTGAIARKRFARATSESPSARTASRSYSHTYVGRWLDGVVPRDSDTRDAIREALGAQLGRVVALDELGFPGDVSPDAGLAYPDKPEESAGTVAQLFEADLGNASTLLHAPPNMAAWNDAAMAWLVSAQHPLAENGGPRRIRLADVDRLRTMRVTFDHLDSTYGGAHARNALVQYLRTELPRLLRAGGSSDVRRALFSAAGESTQLAAWMAYDAGLHGLAQRYFIQALGLADAGEDRLLAASILDAMSHQANYLGRYKEAANLARAARLGTQSAGIPILTAHFHAMEARALARTSDVEACDRAMGAAVEHFAQHTPGDGPEWISYFDAAELSAELGHCNRDLGRPDRAIEHATEALGTASGDYARSDFFVAMVLADAHLDRGDVEEGCRVAAQALAVGETLESARCRSYVDEFKQRLRKHRTSPGVRAFVAEIRQSRLWAPPAGQ
ncbi:MAG: XRE family transcriptional regulator [Pseudonocardiales bacterium]|nr:XRE family transcriptional regulator [Pseudonocardiales bacterium]